MSTSTKIVIDHLAGSRVGERQEFDPVPRLRFGRHPENDVAFDAHRDLDASTRHAELRQEQGRWVLVDVGSSNGTLVGGLKIGRYDVTEGVPIEVEFGQGGPKLRLFVGNPAVLAAVPATIVRSGPGVPPPVTIGAGGAAAPADANIGTAATLAATPVPTKPSSMPAAGAGADAAGAGAPKRPGARTVAMMVQQAVSDAHEKKGLGRSTMFMKSMVDQALHHSTRRFKLILFSMGGVFVAAIAALVVWNLAISRKSVAAGSQSGDEAGPRIVQHNREALYLLAFKAGDGSENPFCSSFAVAPAYLATNSHCVDRINELRRQNLEIFAVKNGDPKTRLGLKSVTQHSGYRSGARKQTTDVALVEVDGKLPVLVKLADRKHLEELNENGVGRTMFIYGFPGRLAKPSEPQATLTQGTIGRVTTLDERGGSFTENILFQHSAFTMEGTSGSPVFDATGVVIAVNTGSYVREKDLRMYDSETKQFKEKVAVAESLSGYNVAIRIDMVGELLSQKGISGQGAP